MKLGGIINYLKWLWEFSLYRRVDTDFTLFSSEISSNQEFLRKQQQQYNIEKPQIVLYQ